MFRLVLLSQLHKSTPISQTLIGALLFFIERDTRYGKNSFAALCEGFDLCVGENSRQHGCLRDLGTGCGGLQLCSGVAEVAAAGGSKQNDLFPAEIVGLQKCVDQRRSHIPPNRETQINRIITGNVHVSGDDCRANALWGRSFDRLFGEIHRFGLHHQKSRVAAIATRTPIITYGRLENTTALVCAFMQKNTLTNQISKEVSGRLCSATWLW